MRTCWHKLDLAVAHWTIGRLTIEEIPAAAVEALADGCKTPSLALLGAMEGSTWSEIEPVVDRVFAERERPPPTNDEAVKLIADAELHELAAGKSDPRGASFKLARLAWSSLWSVGRPNSNWA